MTRKDQKDQKDTGDTPIRYAPISPVALSCLKTMTITSKKDKRQKIPNTFYKMPDEATRRLRALLILEEAFETVRALGFNPVQKIRLEEGLIPSLDLWLDLIPSSEKLDLEKIIDGACDTIYVATGLLCAVGAPDSVHLHEVCKANEAKFPNGVVITNDEGKYLKPAGWKPPDHKRHIQRERAARRGKK